ncbi:MAG: hypothetical protein ABI167_02175 [Nitrosospira sp.]
MGDHVEGTEIIPWVISFAFFVVVPFWKLFKRTGFKPIFSIVALIPGGVVLLLWVVAFAKWPAFAEKKKDSDPPITDEKRDSGLPITKKKKSIGPPVAEGIKDSGPLVVEGKRDSDSPVVEEKKESDPPLAEEKKGSCPPIPP